MVTWFQELLAQEHKNKWHLNLRPLYSFVMWLNIIFLIIKILIIFSMYIDIFLTA
jgi:hypothetical protein